jgi:tetratricopeptide (TPR) repeat protein
MRARHLAILAVWFGMVLSAWPVCAQAEDDRAREDAWRKLFTEGIDAYNRRDEDGAIEKWEAANKAYDLRPEAYNNIAVVVAGRGDHGRAVLLYLQALAVLPRMRAPLESERAERLGARRDVYQGLLGSAEELFRQGKATEAAQALQALTAADLNNREAWYTLGLALYKLQRWTELVPVARRSVELDPLNASARTLLTNALKAANAPPEPPAPVPVYLEDVQMVQSAKGTTLRGTVTGVTAPAGTAIRLEVILDDAGDIVGTHEVTITAPEKGRRAPFSFTVDTRVTATSYRYRVVD